MHSRSFCPWFSCQRALSKRPIFMEENVFYWLVGHKKNALLWSLPWISHIQNCIFKIAVFKHTKWVGGWGMGVTILRLGPKNFLPLPNIKCAISLFALWTVLCIPDIWCIVLSLSSFIKPGRNSLEYISCLFDVWSILKVVFCVFFSGWNLIFTLEKDTTCTPISRFWI